MWQCVLAVRTEGVHVGLVRVLLGAPILRAHVAHAAHFACHPFVWRLRLLRLRARTALRGHRAALERGERGRGLVKRHQPEVSEFGRAARPAEQHVLRLEIPVHNGGRAFVQKRHAARNVVRPAKPVAD